MRRICLFIYCLGLGVLGPAALAGIVPALGVNSDLPALRKGGVIAKIADYDLVSLPFARSDEIGHQVLLRPHGTLRHLVTLSYDLNYQRIAGLQVWPGFYHQNYQDFWRLSHPVVSYLQGVLQAKNAPLSAEPSPLNSLHDLFDNITIEAMPDELEEELMTAEVTAPHQPALAQDTLSLGDFIDTLPANRASTVLAEKGPYQLLLQSTSQAPTVKIVLQIKGLQVYTPVLEIEFYQNYKLRRIMTFTEQYSAAEIASAIHDLSPVFPALQILAKVFALPLQNEAEFQAYLANLQSLTYPENLQRRLAYLWQVHPSRLITARSKNAIGQQIANDLRGLNIWNFLGISAPENPQVILERGSTNLTFYYNQYHQKKNPRLRLAMRGNNVSNDYVIFILDPNAQIIKDVFFTSRHNPALFLALYDEFPWAQKLVNILYQINTKEELQQFLAENGQDMRQIEDLLAQLKNYYSYAELKDFFEQSACARNFLPR